MRGEVPKALGSPRGTGQNPCDRRQVALAWWMAMARLAPDAAALRLILDDLQSTVARQIAVGEAMDEKAAAILRFNAIYLGLGLTAVSFALRQGFPPWTLAYPWYLLGALAIGLLLASISFAIKAYTVTEFFIGLRAADLGSAAIEEISAVFHRRAAIDRYAEGANANGRNLDHTSRWLAAALRTMGPGVGVLAFAAAALIISGNTYGG